MPKREDETYRNLHPAACTCVGCENRKLGRGWLGSSRPQSAMKTYSLTPSEKKKLAEATSKSNPRPTTTGGGGVVGLYFALSILVAIGLFALFMFLVSGA